MKKNLKKATDRDYDDLVIERSNILQLVSSLQAEFVRGKIPSSHIDFIERRSRIIDLIRYVKRLDVLIASKRLLDSEANILKDSINNLFSN